MPPGALAVERIPVRSGARGRPCAERSARGDEALTPIARPIAERLRSRGFVERLGPSRYLLVSAAYADAVTELGLPEPAAIRRALAAAPASHGRAATAVLELPGAGPRLHLRPVRHGGLLAALWRGALLGLGRPIRELEAGAQLVAAGAPVSQPVLVAGWRRCGPLWSAAVGTLHIEAARDGVALLGEPLSPERLLRAAAAAGHAVRRFHDAGGRHADLHIKNLLFREDEQGTRAWVVDLDKARADRTPGPRRRAQELMRLYRSLVKRRLLDRVGRRGCARFADAYVAGDRGLRRALSRQLPRERMRLALHALAYRR